MSDNKISTITVQDFKIYFQIKYKTLHMKIIKDKLIYKYIFGVFILRLMTDENGQTTRQI